MSYIEVLDYLYSRLPMFTRDGSSAFKKDLTNTLKLCEALGNPQNTFQSVHIAGTNGKGSTSHMLAAILQTAGYKTGLYTSPHLMDFRERIKINGLLVPQAFVVNFVKQYQPLIEEIKPSFFEVTVAMAFAYFASEKVDIAIIETGLGGRLDSTNVIHPLLSLITNIGYDHMNLLGNSLTAIADEKAGIIKAHTPVVISERQPLIEERFLTHAKQKDARLFFASDEWRVQFIKADETAQYIEAISLKDQVSLVLTLDLRGTYQQKNVAGVLSGISVLKELGYGIEPIHVKTALAAVQQLTGLMGRWQTLAKDPLVICDTGHNEDGWNEIMKNIRLTSYQKLHMVIGVMRDKDLTHMLGILPKNASYYFCHPAFERALPADQLQASAAAFHLSGKAYENIQAAIAAAKQAAAHDDLIFIGGSTFVVAEALPLFIQKRHKT